jgi:hypothetical protein
LGRALSRGLAVLTSFPCELNASDEYPIYQLVRKSRRGLAAKTFVIAMAYHSKVSPLALLIPIKACQ